MCIDLCHLRVPEKSIDEHNSSSSLAELGLSKKLQHTVTLNQVNKHTLYMPESFNCLFFSSQIFKTSN